MWHEVCFKDLIMAQVVTIANRGRARLARLYSREETSEVRDSWEEERELSWQLLGVATMVLVSGAGWAVIMVVVRHFLH